MLLRWYILVEFVSRSTQQFDRRWPAAGILASVALHVLAALAGQCDTGHRRGSAPSLVDVELVPAAPVAELLPEDKPTVAAAGLPPPEAIEPESPDPTGFGFDAAPAPPDAAPADARPRRRRPDAAPTDAAVDADDAVATDASDAATIDAADAASQDAPLVAGGASGTGGDAIPTDGRAADMDGPSGVTGSNPQTGGVPGPSRDPDGTSANLLPYGPPGTLVIAMIRFDRLRDTRWQQAAENLFTPMPDHRALIGDRPIKIADVFETLVIATDRPRDATATVLVARTGLSRPAFRDLLNQPDAPVTWSAATGGLLGRRGAGPRVWPGDRRLFLSPTLSWFTLAAPQHMPGLTRPAAGALDAVTATVPLPPWLDLMQSIEQEAGPGPGPALLLTLGQWTTTLRLPNIGLGVSSLPAPTRLSLSLIVDTRGFVVRGRVRMASEAAASEFTRGAQAIRKRIVESTLLGGLARRSRLFNAISGLSLRQSGTGVSFATSISTADADALLATAATTVSRYFRPPQ